MKTSEIIRLYSLPPQEFCQIRSTIKTSHRRLKRRILKLGDFDLIKQFYMREFCYRVNKLTTEIKTFLYDSTSM